MIGSASRIAKGQNGLLGCHGVRSAEREKRDDGLSRESRIKACVGRAPVDAQRQGRGNDLSIDMNRRSRRLADPQSTLRRLRVASTRLAGIGVTLVGLCATATVSHSAAPTRTPDQPLHVATGRIAPFVIEEDGRLTGFSIDLWNELARRLRMEFVWTDVGSSADQIQAVRRGDADVAISAITMTQEREKVVDFSHPYFDSGLQIMVRARNESSLLDTIRLHPWADIGELFGASIFIMLVLAHVLWLVERRSRRSSGRGYVPEIGE